MSSDTERMGQLRAIAGWLAAFGEPTRLAMVLELAGGERSVGELAAVGGTSIANTSHHLARLRRAGVVAVTPAGRLRRYRLLGATVTPGAVELAHASGARVTLDRAALFATTARGKRK
ncbi:ArsR/SmtB family transcription factor [Gemmata sp.]|uniref:ArsR/SmtB family transcription factor n=1 Tax=Gemmata sp. TaxID=1914242 RepID=UPI003F725EEC